MQNYHRNLILVLILIGFAIWIVLPNNPGINIGNVNKEISTQLGLDLVGGIQALMQSDLQNPDADAMNTATRIIENRVNGLGVTEALVQRSGNRIIVEMPNQTDPERLLSVLKQTGLLEFVDFSALSDTEINSLLQTDSVINTNVNQEITSSATPTPTIQATGNVTSTIDSSPGAIFTTVMTGEQLKNAQVTTGATGQYEVAFELKDEGAKIFSDFTNAHVGDTLAIILDRKIISAPRIQDPITDGQGSISGSFTYESANALAVQLRYGALPVPLSVVSTRLIGPSLGQDSLRQSLIAGLIGFTIVFLFMAIYYRLPGFVANLAILIYALLTFALFRFIPVTLTLPGIAGFLLSTGSALDANILIFERMKEEIRSGKPLELAVRLGWQRAWPSIRDSNIATLITCAILFWFGSAFGATIVKGFSLTLALGVAISLLTALFVSRNLLELVLSLFKPENKTRWFGL